MTLCIIPARGGSKRLPGKNIKPFAGKPIIAWSIGAALKSELFSHVIVSTDCPKIKAVAELYGATVWERPAELADDHATSLEVMAHELKDVYDSVACMLYATAPFVTAQVLKDSFQAFIGCHKEYMLPVASYPFPIQRALRISDMNRIEMRCPEYANTRSQDLEECFHDAGQFYWGSTNAFVQRVPLYPNAEPYYLSRSMVQDIDTPEDWQHAEALFKIFQKSLD